ncbi:unnamed protein product [Cuscuta europaea]|uniref:Phosphoglycerate mutase-like protein 4 n=1 Tax=Cuscuta europaea TaxID=41803 RepID=A0A9P0ZF86_CUSEU|nr:unnamed protein product [Cuscuta europaea]
MHVFKSLVSSTLSHFFKPEIHTRVGRRLQHPLNPKLILNQRRRFGKFTAATIVSSIMEGVTPESVEQVKDLSPNCTEIIVIRHGETEWNAEGRIQGHLDVELNDMGRQQAHAVANRLSKEPKISAVYSSDLKRAFETAETIARLCGGLVVVKDPSLRERHLGEIQGLLYSDVSETNDKAYQAMVSRQTDRIIPGGGESLDQLYDRCTSSLERIAKNHRGERVVVVSHGGTIRALHRRASSNGRCGNISNASVNIIHLSEDDRWTIKVWGDVSHLGDAGFLKSGFGGDKNSG